MQATEAKPILDKIKKGWKEEEEDCKKLQNMLLEKAGKGGDRINWDREKDLQARFLHPCCYYDSSINSISIMIF
jgi:hypothetical protein